MSQLATTLRSMRRRRLKGPSPSTIARSRKKRASLHEELADARAARSDANVAGDCGSHDGRRRHLSLHRREQENDSARCFALEDARPQGWSAQSLRDNPCREYPLALAIAVRSAEIERLEVSSPRSSAPPTVSSTLPPIPADDAPLSSMKRSDLGVIESHAAGSASVSSTSTCRVPNVRPAGSSACWNATIGWSPFEIKSVPRPFLKPVGCSTCRSPPSSRCKCSVCRISSAPLRATIASQMWTPLPSISSPRTGIPAAHSKNAADGAVVSSAATRRRPVRVSFRARNPSST